MIRNIHQDISYMYSKLYNETSPMVVVRALVLETLITTRVPTFDHAKHLLLLMRNVALSMKTQLLMYFKSVLFHLLTLLNLFPIFSELFLLNESKWAL